MCAFAMCPERIKEDRQIIYSTLESLFYDENEMTLHKKDVFTFVRLCDRLCVLFCKEAEKRNFDFQMVRFPVGA